MGGTALQLELRALRVPCPIVDPETPLCTAARREADIAARTGDAMPIDWLVGTADRVLDQFGARAAPAA